MMFHIPSNSPIHRSHGSFGGERSSRTIFQPLASRSSIEAQTDGTTSWFFQSHPRAAGNMSWMSETESDDSSSVSCQPTKLATFLARQSSFPGFTGGFELIPSAMPTSLPCRNEPCPSMDLISDSMISVTVNKLTGVNKYVLRFIQGVFMTHFFQNPRGGVLRDISYIVLLAWSVCMAQGHYIWPTHKDHQHYTSIFHF